MKRTATSTHALSHRHRPTARGTPIFRAFAAGMTPWMTHLAAVRGAHKDSGMPLSLRSACLLTTMLTIASQPIRQYIKHDLDAQHSVRHERPGVRPNAPSSSSSQVERDDRYWKSLHKDLALSLILINDESAHTTGPSNVINKVRPVGDVTHSLLTLVHATCSCRTESPDELMCQAMEALSS